MRLATSISNLKKRFRPEHLRRFYTEVRDKNSAEEQPVKRMRTRRACVPEFKCRTGPFFCPPCLQAVSPSWNALLSLPYLCNPYASFTSSSDVPSSVKEFLRPSSTGLSANSLYLHEDLLLTLLKHALWWLPRFLCLVNHKLLKTRLISRSLDFISISLILHPG